MPLTLSVDADAWREHLRSFVAARACVVPVTKGNGYGFGNSVLATEAKALGVDTVAVGTYDEIPSVTAHFPGDVLILAPWRPGDDVSQTDGRIVHTVSRIGDLQALADSGHRPRVIVEVLTSVRRHGIVTDEIGTAMSMLNRLRFEGWALHLPLAGDRLAEARALTRLVAAAGSDHDPLWVSHLAASDASVLAGERSGDVRVRIGTALWLGKRSAFRARASVVDVHAIRRGDPFGYRQRRTIRNGSLLVIAGGTAHGIALEAPTPAVSVRQRAVAVAKGGLEAFGQALSPFYIAGKQRWFAEPPHMQCSLIWLPAGVDPPAVGDEVDVDVRMTTTTFDRINWTSGDRPAG
jgi:alanine racemase